MRTLSPARRCPRSSSQVHPPADGKKGGKGGEREDDAVDLEFVELLLNISAFSCIS